MSKILGAWMIGALAAVALVTAGMSYDSRPAYAAVDKKMNILIVDDDKTMLRIMRNLLNQLGFTNVDEATDGATALQKLRAGNHRLILSDSHMERMTGLQLLREVRADAKLRSIPFIMVTAEAKSENIVAAQQAGVSNYIVKPFNAETLKMKMGSVLGSF